MKKVLLALIVLLFSGCSVNYTLSYEDEKFNEQIDFFLPTNSKERISFGDKSLVYDYLLENDFYADLNNTKTYNKEIQFADNNDIVSLKAEFLASELKDAKTINNCFENKIIMDEKDYVYIYLYGKCNCYENKDIVINFNSSYEVISDNSLYEKNGNKVWIIDKKNHENVDIELQVSKYKMERNKIIDFNTFTIVGMVVLVILIVVSIILYKKLKKD